MAQKIQIRNGNASEWTTANPVLSQSEMGHESDTNLFKFGDGVTAWNSLPYATTGGAGLKIGSIFYWPDTIAPDGTFICDGSAISQINYPELFALLGSRYNSSNTTTIVDILTSNTQPPWKVTASTEAEAAYKAFDGIGGTSRWRASTSSGWLKIERTDGFAFTINQYSITGNSEGGYLNRAPKQWVVKDAAGNIVDQRSGELGWTVSQERFYTMNTVTTTALLFDSIVCNQDFVVIQELKLFTPSASETEFGLPKLAITNGVYPCIQAQ